MKLYIVIIIALFISSCNTTEIDNPDNKTKADGILPLAVGNIWNYKEYQYKDDSLLTESDIKLEVVDKIQVDYNNQNIEVFKLQETRIYNGNNNNELYFLLREENDTIYFYGHAVSDTDEYYFNKTIYIKYPIQVGENWTMDHGDYRDNFSCESVNDTININNINYECVRIRMGPGHWYEDTYFSLGIGIIKVEATFGWKVKCNLRRQILINYSFK